MTDIFRFVTWGHHIKTGSVNKKAIFMVLVGTASHETGRCEAKLSTLSEWCEMSEAAVSRNLKALQEAGLIARRAQYRMDHGRRGDEFLILAPWVTEWPDGMAVENPNRNDGVGTPSPQGPPTPSPQGPPTPSPQRGGTLSPQGGQELPLEEQPLENNRFELHLGGENRNGASAARTPCWDLPVVSDDWMPTYTGLSDGMLKIAIEDGVPWAEPPSDRVVFDFWRDLHWHMEAGMVPVREEAIKTALKHYPVRMVCRAVAAGLTDRFIQGEGGPYDKLETMIAITSKRDNVERLGNQVSDEELGEYLAAAEENRSQIARWRAEEWERISDPWRVKNRARLQRDSQGRYRRFMAQSREHETAVA